MPVTLITPTAYARHRGCDEKAVRKAIAAARISTINGMVDPVVADIQWRQNTRARADSGRASATSHAAGSSAAGSHAAAAPSAGSHAAGSSAAGSSAAAPASAPGSTPIHPPAGDAAASRSSELKDEGEYSVNRARRERFEADLAEIKLREQQGVLVDVATVRAEMGKQIGELKTNALQIPARLGHMLSSEQQAALMAELRSVLSLANA